MKHHVLVTLFLLFVTGWPQETHGEKNAIDPESLNKAFIHAVNAIRAGQSEEGYWDTYSTGTINFTDPQKRVNVWMPAIIIDVLDPVVSETNLQITLQRARRYLVEQIEPTGLVSYNRAKQMPPDTDDTSLVWRIVSYKDPELLKEVLSKFEKNRTREGLYRTWIESGGVSHPPGVGTDPNPVDMSINIHIYMFFSKYAPALARELGKAMQKKISDKHYWLYFELAPFIFVLREIDLAQTNCPLTMPEALMHSENPEQELYLDLTRLIRDCTLQKTPEHSREDILKMLRRVAENDFSKARKTPILLYHNDLTSINSRIFYWSEDLIYALWLRLYVEASRNFENWSLPQLPSGHVYKKTLN